MTGDIISLILWNWDYCVNRSREIAIPSPLDYQEERDETPFREMLKRYEDTEGLKKAEQYYKNNLVIEKYLKKNKTSHTLKGTFFVDDIQYNVMGIINEVIERKETWVKWEPCGSL